MVPGRHPWGRGRPCGRRSLSALLLAFIIAAAVCMIYLGVQVLQLPLDRNGYTDKTLHFGNGLWKNLMATHSTAHDGFHVEKERDRWATYRGRLPHLDDGYNVTLVELYHKSDCVSSSLNTTADIRMLDLYDNMVFDNTDGGTWKQGFPIKYNESHWDGSNKLHVFVVPHSHNDPGWLKTFDKYYLDQTQHILNNMVKKLAEDRRRTFIWAEISFFSVWWKRINEMQRRAVRQYLENGQLEIVTGGWVMNDEAVTHYFAMTEQMIEGHEWLRNHVGYFPINNGWSIDPFGLSPTMAYLLKRMGFDNMVIQRVHYSVKKQLAKQQNLEFLWRQVWDHENSTDIVCHLMPFYSYDIPHTCGPDPKVCCQFDFKRLPGGKISCPWKIPPQPITQRNVEQKAMMLLDQYRKKSKLFRTNVVLVPLGDDFRYDKAIEWDQQFTNYQRLFDYMNSRQDWNVHAKFGTLNDYFLALEKDLIKRGTQKSKGLPSLVGDFFTYSDRDDHYWSGFYSSRPFYKSMDRSLESYLRASDTAFTMLLACRVSVGHLFAVNHSLSLLVEARRNLGLFQHHDAITGTSKDFVVVDYATRLLQSIQGLQNVLGNTASLLVARNQFPHLKFDLDDNRVSYSALSKKTVMDVPVGGRAVVLYNSLGWKRREAVSFLVTTMYLCVSDQAGRIIPAQLNPVWKGTEIVADHFELVFLATVPALGFATYKLTPTSLESCVYYSNVSVQSSDDLPEIRGLPWNVSRRQLNEFSLSTASVVATFTDAGFLKSITNVHDNVSLDVAVSFLKYGTRKQKDKSGAYLFLPGGVASQIPIEDHYYRVIQGTIVSEVCVIMYHVEHRVLLKSSQGFDGDGVEVENVVDIGKEKNQEIVMRLETGVQSGSDFFTDLNGFQMIRRQTLQKLPLQANFYPVSSMVHIEDDDARFTAIVRETHGVASLRPGWLEFILDRRLMQDDNRGLQQGVLDNVPCSSHFRFLVEQRAVPAQTAKHARMHTVFPTLTAHRASFGILYPMVHLIPSSEHQVADLLQTFSVLEEELPCDVHLVNMRTMITESESSQISPQNVSLLLLHRVGYDCRFSKPRLGCRLTGGKVNLGHLLAKYTKDEVIQTSLSALYDLKTFLKSQIIELQPMELYAFKIRW